MLLEHTIHIDWPHDEALGLFTPRGEELWVADWRPDYIHPTSGETAQGMVFTTDHGGEKTYWTCLDWRPDQGWVRYLRLNPGSRVSYVTVRTSENPSGGTRVDVSYEVIPLSDAAEAGHAVPTPEHFARYIEGWKSEIEALPRG